MINTIKSPLKFLDPYAKEDGDFFFGRDTEIAQLYESVNKNRLVLVYGQSGTGKTSLVQCGLANRFEVTDWLPFFIRRGNNINESLYRTLSQSKSIGGRPVHQDNLVDTLERISTRSVRPVYLIFDQFEELLILGQQEGEALQEEQSEQQQFIDSIQEILESEKTQSVYMIFTLREEYFASLDDFERKIPSFTSRRLRVEPMRPQQIEDVVMESCNYFNIKLGEGRSTANKIIDNLKIKGGIPLPYLQVYLDMLWREDFRRTYPNGWPGEGFASLTFTNAEVEQFGAIANVLDRFLEERVIAVQEDLAKQFPNIDEHRVRQILDAFTTEEGTKRPINVERKEKEIILSEKAPSFLKQLDNRILAEALLQLERSRILRSDDDSFELAHDTLADLIDKKRTDEQRRISRLQRLVISNFEVHQPLTIGHLSELEEDLDKLILAPKHLGFIEESKSLRKAEQEAELNLQRKRTRRAYLIAVAGIILASLAGIQYYFANQARQRADEKTVEAQKAQEAAEANLKRFQAAETRQLMNDVAVLEKAGQVKMAISIIQERKSQGIIDTTDQSVIQKLAALQAENPSED